MGSLIELLRSSKDQLGEVSAMVSAQGARTLAAVLTELRERDGTAGAEAARTAVVEAARAEATELFDPTMMRNSNSCTKARFLQNRRSTRRLRRKV